MDNQVYIINTSRTGNTIQTADFVEIEEFARSKEEFFRGFLELPNGIPSHDTFRRVFQAVSPQGLQACLTEWLGTTRPESSRPRPGEKRTVGIDGKALRRTFDTAKGLGALHMVSAWATDNGLTLGQVAVDAKWNEIMAIPRLLELLELKRVRGDDRRGGLPEEHRRADCAERR